MPIATNPETGEVMFLDGQDWKPAQRAVNPQTGEVRAFDGSAWVPVAASGGQPSPIRDAVKQALPYGLGALAEPRVQQAIKNIPASGAKFVGDIAHTVAHPIETAEGIGNLGKGIMQKLGVMKGDDAEKYADAVGQFFKERYGSLDAIKKTLTDDPVGAAADVSAILSGGGTLAVRAPGVVGTVGRAAQTAGRVVDPLTAAGAATKVVGSNIAAPVLGFTSGAGTEAVRTAARAGAEGGEAATALRRGMTGAIVGDEIPKEAGRAVAQLRQERGNLYRESMAEMFPKVAIEPHGSGYAVRVNGELKATASTLQDAQAFEKQFLGSSKDVLDFTKVDKALADVTGVKTFHGQVLNDATQTIRQSIGQAVAEWKQLDPKVFHTAEGLDALKQKIGSIRDATEFSTPERLIADKAYNAIKQTIVDQSPKYAEVMKGYESASNIIKEIEKTLSVNPNATIDTSLRKLQSVLRNNVNTNYGRRAELLDYLVNAGAPHLVEKLAGQALSSLTPRGLSGQLAAGMFSAGSGTAAMTGMLAHPGILGGIAAASPRLVGEASLAAGAATRLPLRGLGQSSFQAGRLPQQ